MNNLMAEPRLVETRFRSVFVFFERLHAAMMVVRVSGVGDGNQSETVIRFTDILFAAKIPLV